MVDNIRSFFSCYSYCAHQSIVATYDFILDQSKIENCEEIDLDCYYSLKGHCKKCNHALPVVLYEGNTECACQYSNLDKCEIVLKLISCVKYLNYKLP